MGGRVTDWLYGSPGTGAWMHGGDELGAMSLRWGRMHEIQVGLLGDASAPPLIGPEVAQHAVRRLGWVGGDHRQRHEICPAYAGACLGSLHQRVAQRPQPPLSEVSRSLL